MSAWKSVAMTLALGVAFGAPTRASAQEPHKGGTLVVAMDAAADILDNQAGGGWITWRVNRNMFDTLVMEDLTKSDVKVPPRIGGLAKSWDVSEDGLVYTFHLRDGVKFQDGTDFDANAVKWNIDRMWNKKSEQYSQKAASCTAFSWQDLKSVDVVDRLTVKLTMTKPFGEFIGKLVDGGCGNTSMMSPTNWKKWGNDKIGEHPVGTGPFKFVQRVRGEKIVLQRFKGYWGAKTGKAAYKAPYLDRIIFRPMPDAAARVAALQAGEVDVVWSPPADSIEPMVKKGFKVAMGPTPHLIYFSLNMKQKCLKDPKIREAINYAIDRKGIAKNLLHGTAKPAYSMAVPGTAIYDPNFKPYTYDPKKAKQLIAESSCPEGPKMNWLIPTGGSGNVAPVAISQYVQRNLNEVGFHVQLKTFEWQTYLSFWWKGLKEDQSASWMSWGMTTPLWIEVFADSKWQSPDGSNVGWYKNAKVDALLNDARSEMDKAKRDALYKKANELVSKDAAFVPIINSKTPVLLGPNVHGYVHAPQNWMDFRTVWLSKR